MHKDWPFNGPFEARSNTEQQTNTSFKCLYRIEYAIEDTEEIRKAYLIFKDSDRLKKLMGKHACMVMAPEWRSATDRREVNDGADIETYHRILHSHNALNLSCGTVPLNDVVNPGYKVDARFWKKGKTKRTELSPYEMCSI